MVSATSCDWAILPNPICPILILLLGAFFPNTEDGTIVGKTAVPTAVAVAYLRKFLRFICFNYLIFMVITYGITFVMRGWLEKTVFFYPTVHSDWYFVNS